MKCTIRIMLVGGVLAYATSACLGQALSEPPKTLRMLRAENKLLRSQVQALKERVAALIDENAKLKAGLKKKVRTVVAPVTRVGRLATPEALFATLPKEPDWPREMTDLQRESAVKAFEAALDKWWVRQRQETVRWTLKVKAVDAYDRESLRLVGSSTTGRDVQVRFPKKETARLLKMSKGQMVNVSGRIAACRVGVSYDLAKKVYSATPVPQHQRGWYHYWSDWFVALDGTGVEAIGARSPATQPAKPKTVTKPVVRPDTRPAKILTFHEIGRMLRSLSAETERTALQQELHREKVTAWLKARHGRIIRGEMVVYDIQAAVGTDDLLVSGGHTGDQSDCQVRALFHRSNAGTLAKIKRKWLLTVQGELKATSADYEMTLINCRLIKVSPPKKAKKSRP